MAAWINLLKYFLIKDFKAKYAGSGLGILWSFLLPLIQILIYWIVFSHVMRIRPYASAGNVPYIYFLLSSMFFWLAFSEGLMRASGVIVENAEIIKKVSFSNIVLPVAVTLSSYVTHLIGFVIFIVAYSILVGTHMTFLLVLPVLVLQVVFSIGLGMILSAFLPYVRDLAQLIAYLVQALFFLSPIIYSMDTIPGRFRSLFLLNPFTYFAVSYQKVILVGEVPPLSYMAVMLGLSAVTFSVGFVAFNKLNEGFSDVL